MMYQYRGSTPIQDDEPDSRCGTPAGYEAHRRRGEERCAPCKAAVAARKAAIRPSRAKRARDIAC